MLRAFRGANLARPDARFHLDAQHFDVLSGATDHEARSGCAHIGAVEANADALAHVHPLREAGIGARCAKERAQHSVARRLYEVFVHGAADIRVKRNHLLKRHNGSYTHGIAPAIFNVAKSETFRGADCRSCASRERACSPELVNHVSYRIGFVEQIMKIGIIGAGHIGGTLTRRLRALGHEVHVANSRGPASLHDLASGTGAKAVEVNEAPKDAELLIVTIPEKNISQLPKELLANAPASLIVVDTGNYYPKQRDGKIAEIEQGLPESRWVEKQLGRPVIKAFNNIYAKHLLENGQPAGSPNRIALPVAGDDASAKLVVMDLVEQLGFDPVDAGGLDESWRQQPGTPVYAADRNAEGVREGLAAASPERSPEWKA
jgi:8-hydroxy-5-deazaflavin:NADPH oxidoreductase